MSGGKKKRAAQRRLYREIRDARKLVEEGVPTSDDGKPHIMFIHPSVEYDLREIREIREIEQAAWAQLKK